MLVSAHIHSFRSCSDVSIKDIGSTLVLLGRNGVGKTNLLLALEWAAQIGASRKAEIDPAYANQLGNVTLRFMLEGKTYAYKVELFDEAEREVRDGTALMVSHRTLRESLHIELSTNPPDRVFERVGSHVQFGADGKFLLVGRASPAGFTIDSLLPNDPVSVVIKKAREFLAGFRYFPLDTSAKEPSLPFISETDYQKWSAELGPTVDPKPVRSLHLQMLNLLLTRPDVFAEFRDLIGENGLGLVKSFQITDFQVPIAMGPDDPDSKKQSKYFLFHWRPIGSESNNRFEYDDLSYGTRRLLKLFVALFYYKTTLILIEQPEDGIHAGLLHKVLPLLRSCCSERQIAIATHSAVVLNRVAPEEIRLVDMENGFTTARELSSDEIVAAQEYIAEEGPFATFLEMLQGY